MLPRSQSRRPALPASPRPAPAALVEAGVEVAVKELSGVGVPAAQRVVGQAVLQTLRPAKHYQRVPEGGQGQPGRGDALAAL